MAIWQAKKIAGYRTYFTLLRLRPQLCSMLFKIYSHWVNLEHSAQVLYFCGAVSYWTHWVRTHFHMMTSSNGNIFRVTGHLCGEFPAQRPVTRSFDVFFDLLLNKRLRKQSWGWWFETLSLSLWRHCNASAKAYRRPHTHACPFWWLDATNRCGRYAHIINEHRCNLQDFKCPPHLKVGTW